MTTCSNLNIASGNNFQLHFPVLPYSKDLQDSKDLVLHVYGAILPGVNFDATPHSWQGFDTKRIDSNLIFTDLTVDFLVTEDMRNWISVFKWMAFINNNKDKISGAPKEYTIDSNLVVSDNYGTEILKVKFINMCPIDLNAVNLSYRDGETVLESTCTFAYDRFEIG